MFRVFYAATVVWIINEISDAAGTPELLCYRVFHNDNTLHKTCCVHHHPLW